MYILYDFIFLVFAILYLPYLIFTRRYHSRLFERFGIFSRCFLAGVKDKNLVWLHTVSVGEAIAASSFVKEFHTKFPDYRLLISTVTKTGNRIASTIKQDEDFLIYFPLDLSFIIKKVLNIFKPKLFVIMETEIWPNIVTALYKKKVPIVVMNGRLSSRSFKAYKKVKILLKGVLRGISLFCMQTPRDAARLKELGADEGRIKITGNMKYDAAEFFMSEEEKFSLKAYLGIDGGTKILIAGSTHRGEDEEVISAYKKLLNKFPQLKLLIAPRHIERADEIEHIVWRHNLSSSRFSSPSRNFKDVEVIIVDVIGKLRSLYAISDIVFMGGSLLPRYGGHNLLEPATFKKPIIFGPYMANFKDMAEECLRVNAAIQIRGREDMEEICEILLTDETKTSRLGEAAFNIINQNKGATERNISYIENILVKEGIEQ